ncbi:MAG: S-layer homology domain-containing protein [Solirubrobacterales bacterium]
MTCQVWLKRFFTAVTLAGLMLSTTAQPASAALVPELPTTARTYPYVAYMVNQKIMSGYQDGTFKPAGLVTRAEMAVILLKAGNLKPITPKKASFSDVSKKHWAYAYIEGAAAAGLVKGSQGRFRPDGKVTRAELAALCFGLSREAVPAVALPPAVSDIPQKHWARNAIAAAIDAEMIPTINQKFQPNWFASRADVAMALGVVMTKAPQLRQASLTATLQPLKGKTYIQAKGKPEELVRTNTDISVGTSIRTEANAEADLVLPDGSSLLCKPNSEIVLKSTKGQAYIKADGAQGAAIDEIRVEVRKGRMFFVLATTYLFKNYDVDQTGEKKAAAADPSSQARRSGLMNGPAADDANRSLLFAGTAAESQKTAWYKEASSKRVRIKVDMPWGTAGVRGCIGSASVEEGSQSLSLLEGTASVTSTSGQSTTMGTGQEMQLSSSSGPPAAPTTMPSSEQAAWSAVASWAMGAVATVAQVAPAEAPAPVSLTPEQESAMQTYQQAMAQAQTAAQAAAQAATQAAQATSQAERAAAAQTAAQAAAQAQSALAAAQTAAQQAQSAQQAVVTAPPAAPSAPGQAGPTAPPSLSEVLSAVVSAISSTTGVTPPASVTEAIQAVAPSASTPASTPSTGTQPASTSQSTHGGFWSGGSSGGSGSSDTTAAATDNTSTSSLAALGTPVSIASGQTVTFTNGVSLNCSGVTLSAGATITASQAVNPTAPENCTVTGPVMSFTLNGTITSGTIRLTIPVNQGADASNSAIFYEAASGQWQMLKTTLDGSNLIADVSHFSTYGAWLAPRAEAPVSLNELGWVAANDVIFLTEPTVGATVYYSSDGSTPTVAFGLKYDPAVGIIIPAEGCTVKAIAVKENMRDSLLSQFQFQIGTPLFTESFESGLNGWTATENGLWTAVSNDSNIHNNAYPNYVQLGVGDTSEGCLPDTAFGTSYAWFGKASDISNTYCIGNYLNEQSPNDPVLEGGHGTEAISGSLTSTSVNIPNTAGSNLILRFNSWWEIEGVAPSSFDMMKVFALIDGQEILLTTLNPQGANGGQPALPYTSGGGYNKAPEWMSYSCDLTAYQGTTLQLVFRFASEDANFNGFRGWIVDNVQIIETNPPPPTFDAISVQSVGQNANVVRLAFSAPIWFTDLTEGTEITATVAGETRNIANTGARAKEAASSTLDITLDGAAMTNGQEVVIAISNAGAGKIKQGSSLASLKEAQSWSVTYVDTTPPAFNSISVQSIGQDANVVRLTFSEPVWFNDLTEGVLGAEGTEIWATVAGGSRNVSNTGTRLQTESLTSLDITLEGPPIGDADEVIVGIAGTGPAKIKDLSSNALVGEPSCSIMYTVADTLPPTVNPAKFTVESVGSPLLDRIIGASGAVGEAGALVNAYLWTDAGMIGTVEDGELGPAISLGMSLEDGSLAQTALANLDEGTYAYVITATDECANESAKTAGFAVLITIGPDTTAPTVNPALFTPEESLEVPGLFQISGAEGAVSEAGAVVNAYLWTDSSETGTVDTVDPDEIGPGIPLGISVENGVVALTDLATLSEGTNKYLITATDAAGNESARDAAATVELLPVMPKVC